MFELYPEQRAEGEILLDGDNILTLSLIHIFASDQLALLPVTRRFIFLEEGDIAEVTRRNVTVFDTKGCLLYTSGLLRLRRFASQPARFWQHRAVKQRYSPGMSPEMHG